jgi:glycosyltransferase involved in cell wall biosynthesis
VSVCCLEREGAFAQRLPATHAVHVLHKPVGFSFRAVARLARLIAQTRPHIIHSHNLGPLIYGGLASGLGLCCAILHGEHSLLRPDELQSRRLRQRRWLYRGCRKVHAVSSELRDQLAQVGLPAAKITVLPNGVDTEQFAPRDRAAARGQIGHVPENAFVVGTVGRFGAFKRHALLIEAFDELARQRPDAHLLIVGGGGPEEERVRARARASAASARIHFAGFQDRVTPYYQAMNLLVVPSVNEGMSNAILEAMACNVPVLAHTVCGSAEIITPGVDGLMADLKTVDALHAQLAAVAADSARLDLLGRAARETMVRRFSLGKMIENYRKMYRAVARVATG